MLSDTDRVSIEEAVPGFGYSISLHSALNVVIHKCIVPIILRLWHNDRDKSVTARERAMAESKKQMSVFVTGGAEDVGLATVRALLKRGHKVVASACTSEGALALRQAGALPVYPDLGRASEVLSALKMAEADAIIHAIPQFCGGLPHSGEAYAARGDQLARFTQAVADAAAQARRPAHHRAQLRLSVRSRPRRGAGRRPRCPRQRLRAHAGGGSCAQRQWLERLYRPQRLHLRRRQPVNCGARRCDHGVSTRVPSSALPASWIHEDDLAAAFVALLEVRGPTSTACRS